MKFILTFDIPREMKSLQRRVQRHLVSMGARMIQFSLWETSELQSLIDIAREIKRSGGDARILEERFVF